MAKEIYLRRFSDPSISAVRMVLIPEKELRLRSAIESRESKQKRARRSRVQADDVRAARRIVQQPRPPTWASCCSGTSVACSEKYSVLLGDEGIYYPLFPAASSQ